MKSIDLTRRTKVKVKIDGILRDGVRHDNDPDKEAQCKTLDDEQVAKWEQFELGLKRHKSQDAEKDWFDATLDAHHWDALSDIAPTDAAMLLCCHNPNESSFEAICSDETGTTSYETPNNSREIAYPPKHLRMLARRLVDIVTADPKPRSLRDWHQTAREMGLTYHSWIDAYMEATALPIADIVSRPTGGSAPTDECAVFLAMENVTANEVSIVFVGDKSETGLGANNNMLEVSIRGIKKRITLGSLDLIDKRSGRLNSQGAILLGMEAKKRLPNNPANIKKVQRLREALCANLGIKGDPFLPFISGTGWTPLFTLTDNRGAADKRAKDKAESKSLSIEQMSTLGRQFVAPDQPNDFIDRGERANQRRQDFPADEWMQKNGHTYNGDDFDHDN
ncbi:MAG: hypothetical protein IPG23_00225 [Burkholderiales bacterium]|nr:hypothetical protein [Burkholderiales bacterium]